MKNKVFISIVLVMVVFSWQHAIGQSVSVSPSRLYFKEMLGGYKGQKIRVANNGTNKQTFQITFNDFSSTGNKGKTQILKEEDNNRGCAQWLAASPAFFELAPGVTQDVEILLQVPNVPEANNARWAVANVKLTRERTGPQASGEDVTGMQILQTFQFLVHIFQTPPSVQYKEAQVLSFKDVTTATDSIRILGMEVENVGETILDCAPYLDVVNLQTGDSRRVRSKGFTVLPEGKRMVRIPLPDDLVSGKYNILGVIDYGSDTDLAGAQLEISIE